MESIMSGWTGGILLPMLVVGLIGYVISRLTGGLARPDHSATKDAELPAAE